MTNMNLADIECSYEVFGPEVLEGITLEQDRFSFEPEVMAKVAKLGARICESGRLIRGNHQEGTRASRYECG